MSAAIRRNWKTIVPILTLLLAVLFGIGLMNLLHADDEPLSPPPLFPDTGTQSITHLPGVDQWVQFTFTERTSLTFTTTEASPDTALLLYGPGDSNTLYNAHWPDYITGFRVLSQVGDYALEAGTYYLQVTELAGGMVFAPFTVEYFTGEPTNAPAAIVLDPPPAEFDPTNAPALAISSTPQLFTHSPGVDQWLQFTLLEPCEVTFTATDASLDTAILLYGPDDPALLINGAWPDFFSGRRVLSQTGANALAPGTYFVSVADLAGGLATTPFTVEYFATPVSSIIPDTNTVFLMTPEAPEVGAFTLPMFAGSTNELLEIMPGPEWQSFDYTIGTTQWVYFTLTQRTDLSVYLDMAGPDTMLLLYGPDSATNLSQMVPADPAAYWRVLDATGNNALATGTYLLAIVEPATEPATNTYPIWFTATLTPEAAPEGTPGGDPSPQAAPIAVAGTRVNVTLVVTQGGVQGAQVSGVEFGCQPLDPNISGQGGVTKSEGKIVLQLQTGQKYRVTVGKKEFDGGGIWSFTGPDEISVSKAATYNFEAKLRPNFGVSGVTREDNGQPLFGVELNFASVSALPPVAPLFTTLVKSDANGKWTNRAFAMNYGYRVTPFKADANWSWQFTPASLTFTTNQTNLNFTARRVPGFSMSGSVAEASTGFRLNGAKIVFRNQSFPNGFCPNPTFTGLLSITNGTFPVYQPGLWRQTGFATNIGYRIIPSVAATGSTGGKWTFNPTSIEVTNRTTSVDFTASYVENPANLYTLSGKVTDTATGAGVPKVLVHFTVPSGNFAAIPTSVLTGSDGTWMQTGFQKSNFHGEVTYYMKASVNTNIGPGLPYLPQEGTTDATNRWIISESYYSPPTAGNSIAVNSQSRKTDLNFLLTRFKYGLDYSVMLTNGFTLTAADWLVLTNGLRQAANYLYDATDGQVIFKSFAVSNYSSANFTNANIQLLPTGRSHALLNSEKLRLSASDTAFTAAGVSNQFKLHATLVHELLRGS